MSDFILPVEEFNEKAELADIGRQLSIARSELSAIQENKNKHIKEITEEAQAKVTEMVKNASSVVGELKKYRQELTDFKNTLVSFADELKEKRKVIEKQQGEYEKSHLIALNSLEAKSRELESMATAISMDREAIASRRKEQDKRELALNDKERATRDQFELLERTIKRVKA